jgi:hypothetical protein
MSGGHRGGPFGPFQTIHRILPLRRPSAAPNMVIVRFTDSNNTPEDILNVILQQALTSVLGNDVASFNVLQEMFQSAAMNASLNALKRASPTNKAFLQTLEEQWWSQLKANAPKSNSDCSICLSDFESNDIVLQLPCHHVFHSTCVLPWLNENNICPTCRLVLPTEGEDYSPKTSGDNEHNSSQHQASGPITQTSFPDSVMDDTELDQAVAAVVEEEREGRINVVADEIVEEMMDLEANHVVQEWQEQRRRLIDIDMDRMLEEVIKNDKVE